MIGFCRVALYVVLTLPAIARAQTFAHPLIRLAAKSRGPQNSRLTVSPDGRLSATSVPVITLLSYAFDVPSNPSSRLRSLPRWTVTERYDIDARTSQRLRSGELLEEQGQNRLKQMIRDLLTDQFKLAISSENERMPVYALKLSSGGPKFQKASLKSEDCVLDSAVDGCHTFAGGFGHPLISPAASMEDLAHYIENWADLPVVNHTNLNGVFSLNTVGWRPMVLPPPPPGVAPNPSTFETLSTISDVLGKLGLELARQEDVLPVYTIQRIQQPAEHRGSTLTASGRGSFNNGGKLGPTPKKQVSEYLVIRPERFVGRQL
jgi:uncharacterized protein (TIGR03435 family)